MAALAHAVDDDGLALVGGLHGVCEHSPQRSGHCAAGCVAIIVGGPERRTQPGPHEHGVASLNLVVDGNLVSLELDSPAANLVGFEHTPGTPSTPGTPFAGGGGERERAFRLACLGVCLFVVRFSGDA